MQQKKHMFHWKNIISRLCVKSDSAFILAQANNPKHWNELVEVTHANHILLSKYSGTRYKGKRTSLHSVRQWRKCQTQTSTPKNIHNLTIIKIIPARKQRINKFNKIEPLIVPKIGMLTTCLKQNQDEMIPKFLNISNQQLTRTATNIMTIPLNF